MTLQAFTVFVEEIPSAIPAENVESFIKNKISEKFLPLISSVKSFPDYEKLFLLFEKRTKLNYTLEKLSKNPKKRFCIAKDEKNSLTKSLNLIEQQIKLEINSCFQRNIGYGFIFCNSQESAHQIISETKTLSLKPGPCDTDII